MFTGIIEAMGKLEKQETIGGDSRITVSSSDLEFSDVKIGDSIAVSGICLTATTVKTQSFSADVSGETIRLTTLKNLLPGDLLNLEKSMTPSSRLSGHIVSGHVDGVAELISRRKDGRSESMLFKAPIELSRYIAQKGSVCLDGVSLTVNEVSGSEFSINIIPHTAASTTFHTYLPGRKVNLEVDIISRYLERLLQAKQNNNERPDKDVEASGISMELLTRCGFTNMGLQKPDDSTIE